MSRSRVVAVCATVVLAGISIGSGLTAQAAPSRKGPVAPLSGPWAVDQNGATTDVEASAGGFVITTGHHRFVKDLHVTIGPDAETACGTGNLRVIGKHAVYDAKGTLSEDGSKYNVWVVGTHNGTGIHGDKVMVARAGKTFKATVAMSFIGRKGGKATNKLGEISGGHIDYPNHTFGSGCELTFGYKHS